MAKAKFHGRHSPFSLSLGDAGDKDGRIFISGAGMFDLSKVAIVGATVDTVRQLYTGLPKSAVVERVLQCLEDGADYPSLGVCVDCRWVVGKLPKISGYRYKLQNNEVGIVVLFGSYYSALDTPGSHLKLEISPHLLSSLSAYDIQQKMDFIASSLLVEGFYHAGCAVHLAADFQGWDMPLDFQEHFVTYSRVVRSFEGITKVEFGDHSSFSASYGRKERETITFGKPQGIQTSIYRKDIESQVSDKVDYFNEVWGVYSQGEHQPGQPVWRVESRLHHTVTREIGEFLGHPMESFVEIADYLADIWRYAMMRNRYDHSSVYIHPLWQYLIESSDFRVPAKGVAIKRTKKKSDVSAVGINIAHMIGNLITLSARHNFKPHQVLRQLKSLDVWSDIIKYYFDRGLNESDLWQQIEKGLCLRRLVGKAA